jgi:hypothetical protein
MQAGGPLVSLLMLLAATLAPLALAGLVYLGLSISNAICCGWRLAAGLLALVCWYWYSCRELVVVR